MTAQLIGTPATFAFADGSTGHVINLGSAPAVGQLDVLCVNSNTVVTTPAGFTAAVSAVGGQGAYIYRRTAVGGEGSTVTITTSGDHNTCVQWSRWGDVTAPDQAGATQVNGVDGNSTPAHSTGPLADTGELVIAFGALHSLGTTPTNPQWSAGYTPLTAVGPQGAGGTGVVGYTAYRTNAGTAAETPQVTWTGGAADRYMLTLTYTSVTGQVIQPGVATAGEVASSAAAGQQTSILVAGQVATDLAATGGP